MLLRIFLAVCNIISIFSGTSNFDKFTDALLQQKQYIFISCCQMFVCDQVKPIHSLSRPITQTHFSATEFCTNCKCINQERWNISSMIKHSLIGGGGGGKF